MAKMATDIEVDNMIDIGNGSEDLDETKCGPCNLDGELVEAVGMCTTCLDFLCQKCFDSHKIPRPLRNHELVLRMQTQQAQVSLTRKDVCTDPCTQHEDEIIKYHCLDHNALGCSVCITLDHRTCANVHHIPKVAKDLQNNKIYLDNNSKLQSMHQAFNNVALKASNMTLTLELSKSTAMEKFRNFKQNAIKALDDIETEMEQNISSMEKDENAKIALQLNKCKTSQDVLQGMNDIVKKLNSEKQSCRLYTYVAKVGESLKPLEDQLETITHNLSLRTFVFKFASNEEILDALKKAGSGKLTLESEKVTIENAYHTEDINVRLEADKVSCDIRGCALLPDGRLVLSDYENFKLKCVDVEANSVKSFIELPSFPWDIASIDNTKLAITLPKEKRIAFVSLADTPSVERYMDVEGECRGVAYKDDKLALSYMSPYKVQVISLHGTVLHNIPNSRNLYNRPTYIEFGHALDTLYVTNSNSNSVVCLNFDGTIKHIFDDTKLQRPRKVITDKSGAVYVCTRGPDTVHQLSSDLKKIKVLIERDDGMQQPSMICYNETRSEFYLGGISDTLKMYHVLQKTM